MRHSDDINQGPFDELIATGRLYQAFAAAEAQDYKNLLERASEIDGVEVIGGAAHLPDGPKVGG